MKKQQARLRQYAGQVADYEQEIERLKAQLDKLISCGGCCSGRVQRKAAINWKIKSAIPAGCRINFHKSAITDAVKTHGRI